MREEAAAAAVASDASGGGGGGGGGGGQHRFFPSTNIEALLNTNLGGALLQAEANRPNSPQILNNLCLRLPNCQPPLNNNVNNNNLMTG